MRSWGRGSDLIGLLFFQEETPENSLHTPPPPPPSDHAPRQDYEDTARRQPERKFVGPLVMNF